MDGVEYSSVPALKIGRLSTHRDFEGKGYGSSMIEMAFSYLFRIHDYSGCRVMTVDSKKGCEGFYEHFGFKRASKKRDDSTPMYMDVSNILAIYCRIKHVEGRATFPSQRHPNHTLGRSFRDSQ